MSRQRNHGVDLLRAIAIALVFVWHLQPLSLRLTPRATAAGAALFHAADFFNWEMSLVAVPTFFLVSLFLFFEGAAAAQDRLRHLGARLLRVGYLLLFWVGIQIAVAALGERRLPSLSPAVLLAGGPPLPLGVGGSVFYFLADLLVLTILASAYGRLPDRPRRICGAAAFVALLALFEYRQWSGAHPPYYRIENFVALVPAAHWLHRHRDEALRWRIPLLIGWAAFAVHDEALRWWLGRPLPAPYARASIAFGALALCSFAMTLRVRVGAVAGWLSRHSLGLFAVHKFWMYATAAALPALPALAAQGISISASRLVAFPIVAALSVGTVALLARTPLRRFVR